MPNTARDINLSSRSGARSWRGRTSFSSTSRRSGSRRSIVDIVFGGPRRDPRRGVTVLLVEQRAQRTVAFADRTYLISNGEVRLYARPRRRRTTRSAMVARLLRRMIVAARRRPDARRRRRARRRLRADGGRASASSSACCASSTSPTASSIMAGAYAARVHVAGGLADLGGDRRVLRRRDRALDARWIALVFRPLRTQSPAVMLVDDVRGRVPPAERRAPDRRQRDDTIGEPAASRRVAQPGGHGRRGVDVRKVTIVAIVVAAVCARAARAAARADDRIGLQMRAAATDFRHGAAARRPREPRDRRRGAPLGACSRRPSPSCSPCRTRSSRPTSRSTRRSSCSSAWSSGGIDRLWTATLGGFTIGFAIGRDRRGAADRPDRVPAVASCSRS